MKHASLLSRALRSSCLIAASGASLAWAACSGSEPQTQPGTGGEGGEGGFGTSPASVSVVSVSSASSGSSAGGAGSTGSTGGAGSTGSAGGAGGAGGGASWPSCDAKPEGVPEKTIAEIWNANYETPTPVWVSGAYVTAVSRGGCQEGLACQIYLQSAESFADLAGAAHNVIKIFASANGAPHMGGVQVGDRVDVLGHAWRYNLDGQNELLIQSSSMFQGCAKKVGTGNPQPVAATLADLTLKAYEETHGPVFVKVANVGGKPKAPNEVFALYEKGGGGTGGGSSVEEVVTMTPFFLPGGTFTGLEQDKFTQFLSVTGVFSLFVPKADPVVKYRSIAPRTMADVVKAGI